MLATTDGHWLDGQPVKYSHDDSPAGPVTTPSVMGVHGIAPFKCMKAPLAASIKKIKGDCWFLFQFFSSFYLFISLFLEIRSEQHKLSSPGRKGNGKLLLSLKLQGASFIMKVQRQWEMSAAAFSHSFFSLSSSSLLYPAGQLHGIIGRSDNYM